MKHLFNAISILLISLGLLACTGGQAENQTANSKKNVVARLVGSEIQVSAASEDQSNPRVAYLSDKKLFFAVWEDYRDRNTTGADIYGQFIAGDGTLCGSEILLSKDGSGALYGNQTAPDVAYRQDKVTPGSSSLVVIWQDSAGSISSGFIKFINITGLPADTSCGTTPAVSTPVAMNYNQLQIYDSGVTTPTSQPVTIAKGTALGNDILATYVVPGSVNVTGTYTQNDGLTPSVGPVITVNASDDGAGKIVGAGLSAGTIKYNTGSLAITLSSLVDIDAADAVLTVSYDIYSVAPVPRTDDLLSRKSPRIIYDSVDDQFLAAWIESRNTNNVSSVKCFGVPFAMQFGDSNLIGYARINKNGSTFNTNGLGVNGADIYRNDQIINGTHHKTLFNRLIGHTAAATEEVYTFEYFTNTNSPVIASDPTSPERLFAWEGVSNTETLTCKLDTTTGIVTGIWSAAPTNDGLVHVYAIFDKAILLPNTFSSWIDYENSGAGTNPSIAVDDTSVPRKFLLAWEDMRGGSNTKIFGQLINSGGGLYNNNRMLSYQDSAGSGTNDAVITNSRQTKPFVSYDAVNQRYFVMWQDERNSSTSAANIDLYGQFVNLDGSLSGANYSISSNPSNQLAPAIAYDAYFKRFLAVWKDARNINPPGTTASDIYGQLFSIGQPQMTLLTNTTPQLQLIPAVHDFGAVESGVWKFVVKNTGDTTLVVDTIAPSQLPSAPFSIAPTNAATLAPGSSATYTVTFAPTSSGTYNSSFTLTSDGGNQTVALSATGTIIAPLSITTPAASAWPNASTSGPYSIQMIAAGGYTPLTWSATGLPAAFSINPTSGLVSGSDPLPGNYNIAVTVTDGSTPAVKSTRNYTLKVGSTIIIDTTPLSTWTQGMDYLISPVHSVSSTGGTGTVTWMLLAGSGAKPPGINFAGSTGIFSGAATSSGTYSFTLVATDGLLQSSQAPFSITINPSPVITTSSLSSGVIGFVYSQQLAMTGGTAPIVWSYSGALPPGLGFDAATGILSGTPSSAGSYDLTFSVTDAAGASSPKTLNLTIYPTFSIATPSTGIGSPPPAVVGAAYKSFTFKTNYGGAAPYSWVKSGGALPAGLSLNQDTGILSGTPTSPGEYTFILKVTDANGAFTSKTFLVSVLEASTSVNVQLYGQTNAVVSSYSAVPLTNLTGTPAGISSSGATQMRFDGLTSGETVNVAASFVAIPLNPVFYIVNGSVWTQFTPDSIISNTIFYKIKDRSSPTDTDVLALRDLNAVSGVIESTVVVAAITTPGTPQSSSTTTGSVSSSGGGSGCFIATAAYGSYLDPHVMVLRHFRDDVLLQSVPGTAFVRFYYKYSPPIADFIAQHDTLRTIMRFALTPLIFAVKYPLLAALLFAFAGVWFVRRRMGAKNEMEMVQQAG